MFYKDGGGDSRIAGEWLTENELEFVSNSSLLEECCARLLCTIWYLGRPLVPAAAGKYAPPAPLAGEFGSCWEAASENSTPLPASAGLLFYTAVWAMALVLLVPCMWGPGGAGAMCDFTGLSLAAGFGT